MACVFTREKHRELPCVVVHLDVDVVVRSLDGALLLVHAEIDDAPFLALERRVLSLWPKAIQVPLLAVAQNHELDAPAERAVHKEVKIAALALSCTQINNGKLIQVRGEDTQGVQKNDVEAAGGDARTRCAHDTEKRAPVTSQCAAGCEARHLSADAVVRREKLGCAPVEERLPCGLGGKLCLGALAEHGVNVLPGKGADNVQDEEVNATR
jgi:hypothetical protein